MALRKILTTKEEFLLRRKSKEVSCFDQKLKELVCDMKETMVNAEGAGLAAPQVGILKRVIICNINNKVIELINPRIIKQSKEKVEDIEGCLSVPSKRGYVERPLEVTVTAQDINGSRIKITGKEYGARVLCHEIDHLDGVLYTDKASKIIDI
ncbi:MAG: peptide deformylase [Clostridia bacterium]|nr:peptide deformylase [Clostridia bacterium]